MDIKKELVEIIKKHPIGCDCYLYPNIPEKKSNKIGINVDPGLFLDDIVGIWDFTLTGNMKDGLIITTSGFYFKEVKFGAKYNFFNFAEITKITEFSVSTNDFCKYWSGIYIKDGNQLRMMIQEIKDFLTKNDILNPLQPSGIIKPVEITDKEKKRCHAIIHSFSALAAVPGAAGAQFPCSDNAVLVPLQITMITSLSAVFGIHLMEGAAKGIIGSCAGTIIGRSTVEVLIGWIPGAGNAINAGTATGLTEIIGWTAVKNLSARAQAEKGRYAFEQQKKGYVKASLEYERKFTMQAELFASQQLDIKKNLDFYKELCNDMLEYIQKLENEKDTLGNGDKQSLENVKNAYEKIRKLA